VLEAWLIPKEETETIFLTFFRIPKGLIKQVVPSPSSGTTGTQNKCGYTAAPCHPTACKYVWAEERHLLD
jgi:hypothetical protein